MRMGTSILAEGPEHEVCALMRQSVGVLDHRFFGIFEMNDHDAGDHQAAEGRVDIDIRRCLFLVKSGPRASGRMF